MKTNKGERMKKQKIRTCTNCRNDFMPTGSNQKFCEACRPAMRAVVRGRARENEKYRQGKKQYVPKQSSFDYMTKLARDMGISYGRLQVMMYTGQI